MRQSCNLIDNEPDNIRPNGGKNIMALILESGITLVHPYSRNNSDK